MAVRIEIDVRLVIEIFYHIYIDKVKTIVSCEQLTLFILSLIINILG
jgi:hypothetical protein